MVATSANVSGAVTYIGQRRMCYQVHMAHLAGDVRGSNKPYRV